ncbi:MAG TPA: hypothetical protein VGM26_15305 [Rhizomicrobium sp.]
MARWWARFRDWLEEKPFSAVSIAAILFALVDSFLKPISWITVALVGIAMFPWFVRYISAVELPAGVKISLRERAERLGVEAQTIVSAAPVSPETGDLFQAVLANPDVALAGLRIEIERRLLTMARLASDFSSDRIVSITWLVRQLEQRDVIASREAELLLELIPVLNAASHARAISSDIRSWVVQAARPMLGYLDGRIRELEARPPVKV